MTILIVSIIGLLVTLNTCIVCNFLLDHQHMRHMHDLYKTDPRA